jgi:hypothetical protein
MAVRLSALRTGRDLLEAERFPGPGPEGLSELEVASSIPDGVTGFFSSLNPSWGSTQPLTEMNTRNLHEG